MRKSLGTATQKCIISLAIAVAFLCQAALADELRPLAEGESDRQSLSGAFAVRVQAAPAANIAKTARVPRRVLNQMIQVMQRASNKVNKMIDAELARAESGSSYRLSSVIFDEYKNIFIKICKLGRGIPEFDRLLTSIRAGRFDAHEVFINIQEVFADSGFFMNFHAGPMNFEFYQKNMPYKEIFVQNMPTLSLRPIKSQEPFKMNFGKGEDAQAVIYEVGETVVTNYFIHNRDYDPTTMSAITAGLKIHGYPPIVYEREAVEESLLGFIATRVYIELTGHLPVSDSTGDELVDHALIQLARQQIPDLPALPRDLTLLRQYLTRDYIFGWLAKKSARKWFLDRYYEPYFRSIATHEAVHTIFSKTDEITPFIGQLGYTRFEKYVLYQLLKNSYRPGAGWSGHHAKGAQAILCSEIPGIFKNASIGAIKKVSPEIHTFFAQMSPQTPLCPPQLASVLPKIPLPMLRTYMRRAFNIRLQSSPRSLRSNRREASAESSVLRPRPYVDRVGGQALAAGEKKGMSRREFLRMGATGAALVVLNQIPGLQAAEVEPLSPKGQREIKLKGLPTIKEGELKSAYGLLQQRIKFDLVKVLDNADILFFGEYHPESGIKYFIKAQLPSLYNQGIRQLAMEQIPSSMQDDLDKWDEQARRKIMVQLRDFGHGAPEAYMQVIDEAKRLHMRVIGIEHPNSSQMDRVVVNRHWAEIIESNLHNGKIVVLCGSAHLAKSRDSVSGILKEKKLSVAIAEFTGYENDEELASSIEVARIVGDKLSTLKQMPLAIKAKGLDHELFMVKIEDSGETVKIYWLINLPVRNYNGPKSGILGPRRAASQLGASI